AGPGGDPHPRARPARRLHRDRPLNGTDPAAAGAHRLLRRQPAHSDRSPGAGMRRDGRAGSDHEHLAFDADTKALTEVTVFLMSSPTAASCPGVGDEDSPLMLF